MITNEELVELANLWVDLDPNVASALYTLAFMRVADKTLNNSPQQSLEEWYMGICVAITNQAMHEVSYSVWVQTGGTENETTT